MMAQTSRAFHAVRHRLAKLWQSAVGVVNRATTLIAIACIAFAAMQEMSQRTILPTWLWWSAALVLLFLSGTGLQWQLMKEQHRNAATQPDRTLSEVIDQILGTQDPDSLGASTRLSQLFARIRETASLGLISVWGRKNAKPHHLDFYPLERIPASHWSGAQIDFLAYARDPQCATSDARHPGCVDHYADLHFNSAQIREHIRAMPFEAKKAEMLGAS